MTILCHYDILSVMISRHTSLVIIHFIPQFGVLTIDDLTDAIREKGFFDLSTVRDAVIETNGTVSVLQKSEESPVTPKQLSLSVEEQSTPVPIVTDGKPAEEYFGKNEISLSKIEQFVKKSGKEMPQIMLLTADSAGNIFIIPKREETK